MPKTYVIGDIHGYRDTLENLLRAQDLVDKKLHWSGDDTHLWFAGDFFDRGPDGVGTVDLIMKLQKQATKAGGQVGAVLGNHDVLLLGACLMTDKLTNLDLGEGRLTFFEDWLRFGTLDDYDNIKTKHIDWLLQTPFIVQLGDYLLAHADAPFYMEYGDSIESCNTELGAVLQTTDADAWDILQERFGGRRWFYYDEPATENITQFLDHFGGQRLVHGHTPIDTMIDVEPTEVTEPYIYADGLCINVDGRIYGGCPGFAYKLPPVKVKK